MADTKREIERKYEADESAGLSDLPDLTRVVRRLGRHRQGRRRTRRDLLRHPDQRLAAASLTLRRRTGGDDAGWHLKLPVSDGVRDEIQRPALRHRAPRHSPAWSAPGCATPNWSPSYGCRSARDVRHLVDASGGLLAEISVDRVHAERLSGGDGTAEWTEIEVELADDGDPAFLDKVEKKLRKAGVSPLQVGVQTGQGAGGDGPQGPRQAGRRRGGAGHRRRPRPRLRPRPARRDRRTRPRRTAGRPRLRAQHARRHPPDCAAPSARTARSWTGPSPTRSATN